MLHTYSFDIFTAYIFVGALMSYKKQVVLGGHLSMATPSVTGSSGEHEWPLSKKKTRVPLNFKNK